MIKNNFLFEIQRIKKAYNNEFKQLRADYDLTQNEIDILLFLSNNPGHDTARDIVELRSLAKSQVSKSVETLLSRGYLQGTPDTSDRRCIHLSIEPLAAAIATHAGKTQDCFMKKLMTDIPKENMKIIEETYRKVRINLERLLKNAD